MSDRPARDLKHRTKAFALGIVRLYCRLPKSTEAQVMGKQLLRSGTSVGAHYREATRARSDAEFASKLDVGLQELEESVYWMELLADSRIVPCEALDPVMKEAGELLAILTTCSRNAKARK